MKRRIISIVAGGRGADFAGLRPALDAIAAGEADALSVATLATAASSLSELVRLIDWLDDVGGSLIADDVGLDTATAEGERAVAVLREIDSWDRTPHPGRPPRGRPGVAARSPELALRLGEMRERGLSLQAIADALNDDGVPTPRGGAQWRPSSVQAALGYRRPRPPAPGIPPPRPPARGMPPPHASPPGGPPRRPRPPRP